MKSSVKMYSSVHPKMMNSIIILINSEQSSKDQNCPDSFMTTIFFLGIAKDSRTNQLEFISSLYSEVHEKD